jgi:putative spermidine/putrescine transport system permease protein
MSKSRYGSTWPGGDAQAWLLILPAVLVMAVFYIYPLLSILWISVTEPAPGLANYALLASSAPIHRVFATTLRICLLTSAIAVLLGYLISYVLASVTPALRRWIFLCVLLPMWISALVRAFAWVVLLRREGVFNSALLSLGLIDHPLALIWNELGVVIGMVHYMVPYAVLPLYANMRDIDRRCVAAARGLGASRTQTFLRVFLPLSVPGIVGSGVLVFVYSLGFFVTPAILGGGKTLMIAEFIRLQIVEILRWGTGTMLATVLIVTVLALIAGIGRVVGLRRIFGGARSL